MHPPEVKAAALELVAKGLNDCEISRRMGIPRGTIRNWRRPTYVAKPRDICPRCWQTMRPLRPNAGDYAELLGLYLGDGSISHYARTQRLRIVLDRKYPKIIEDLIELLRRIFPENRVNSVSAPGCVHVSIYSSHLRCLFPQDGAGPKHLRPIVLEDWQQDEIAKAPWDFLRGCIRSDGCCFVNRTGPYEYLTYDFSNMSQDIVQIFTAACDLVGVEYRVANGNAKGLWDVRINRRRSVAAMLRHVGCKE
jgi:hypothetical protein